MMFGKLNQDRLCRVIEQILNERDENVEVKVRLISEEEAEVIRLQQNELN